MNNANVYNTNVKSTNVKNTIKEGRYLRGAEREGRYLSGAEREGRYLRGAEGEGRYSRGAEGEGRYSRGALAVRPIAFIIFIKFVILIAVIAMITFIVFSSCSTAFTPSKKNSFTGNEHETTVITGNEHGTNVITGNEHGTTVSIENEQGTTVITGNEHSATAITGTEHGITALEKNKQTVDAPRDITTSPSISNRTPTETPTNSTKTDDVLILVNKQNKLQDHYSPNLTTIDNVKVDKILVDDLKEMQNAAEKENTSIKINTGYRTTDEQEKIFNNTVSEYVNQGNSRNVAEERARQVAALPGYSEHHTGLAIDFTMNGTYDEKLEMWDWLSLNAYKYGFILRYPKGKENITGYDYEAWHYRYVGKQHAKEIYEQGFVLEEYLDTLD